MISNEKKVRELARKERGEIKREIKRERSRERGRERGRERKREREREEERERERWRHQHEYSGYTRQGLKKRKKDRELLLFILVSAT